MKREYNKPAMQLYYVLFEESIVTASIDTEQSTPLITKEEEEIDNKVWSFDLEP